jgi:hypothetical protein
MATYGRWINFKFQVFSLALPKFSIFLKKNLSNFIYIADEENDDESVMCINNRWFLILSF